MRDCCQHKRLTIEQDEMVELGCLQVALLCENCGASWAGAVVMVEPPVAPELDVLDDQGRVVEPIYRHGEQRGMAPPPPPHHDPLDPGHHGGILVHDSEAIGSFEDEDGRTLAFTVHGSEHDQVDLGFDADSNDPCTEACYIAGALRLL